MKKDNALFRQPFEGNSPFRSMINFQHPNEGKQVSFRTWRHKTRAFNGINPITSKGAELDRIMTLSCPVPNFASNRRSCPVPFLKIGLCLVPYRSNVSTQDPVVKATRTVFRIYTIFSKGSH